MLFEVNLYREKKSCKKNLQIVDLTGPCSCTVRVMSCGAFFIRLK